MCSRLSLPLQVSLTHPLLLSKPLSPSLKLTLHQLFSTDYSAVTMAAAEANPQSSARSVGGFRRRGCMVRHAGGSYHRLQQQMMSARLRPVPDHCYLSLSLFPLSHANLDSDCSPTGRENSDKMAATHKEQEDDILTRPLMAVLLRLRERREFLLNLVLGVCQYRVTNQELVSLPLPLQALVNQSQEEEREREGQLVCLRLLCWLTSLAGQLAEREGLEAVCRAVAQLMVSLLHACFLASPSRQTGHLCCRLITSLFRCVGSLSLFLSLTHTHTLILRSGVQVCGGLSLFLTHTHTHTLTHTPSLTLRSGEKTQAAVDLSHSLLKALPLLLPLLPLSPSAACVQWFLRVVAMVTTKSHDRHVILQQCLGLLVELARQLEKKCGPLSRRLQAQ